MRLLRLLLFCLQVWGPEMGSYTSDLDPNGTHMCRSSSQPQGLTCCPGWRQEGRECVAELCRGAEACREEEVCVPPGICRCKPGLFGANCLARCPEQYWGPDCKESCLCHPNGKCDPVSGACTCHPGRWGKSCQFACPCGPRGRCDALTGACHCEPGWFAPDCKRQCLCNLPGSRCDSATGRCFCNRGWWGKRCFSPCRCNGSPCTQDTGQCECRAGQWGPACQYPCQCMHGSCSPVDGQCTCEAGYWGQKCSEPCPPGAYGPRCRYSCGHCKPRDACSRLDGSCLSCAAGWNGTRCNQSCPAGRHGENCALVCPRCLRAEACHPETGECQNCEPGFMGARCEVPCPLGFFGEGCRFSCPPCFNGSCDPVTGTCVCKAGYWGTSCNMTCPEGFYSFNCSERCQCADGVCHPLSGDCQLRVKNQEALIIGILSTLLLLLLFCICCCCCCCRSASMDARDRGAAADGNPISRMKQRVAGTLASLSTLLCFSLGAYKLPRVMVSHHDAEIPFNPSFIEPPSVAWPLDSSFSSFDTDEDQDDDDEGNEGRASEGNGGPAYHLPTSEAQDAELLPEASASNPEPFAIPRTSSLAKAKRPSVSFAEGTRFGPQTPAGSTETLDASRKPKAPWGLARVASPPPQPATDPDQELPHDGDSPGSLYENVEAGSGREEEEEPQSTPSRHRKRVAGSRHVAQRVEALEAASKAQAREGVTTIYVTVGKASGGGRPGLVGAALQQLGSLQRATPPPRKEPRLRRSLEGPLRRALELARSARMPMSQGDEAGAEAEARDTAAPTGAEGEEGEGGDSPPGQNPPKMGTGVGASEEKAEIQEPQYENVSISRPRPLPQM